VGALCLWLPFVERYIPIAIYIKDVQRLFGASLCSLLHPSNLISASLLLVSVQMLDVLIPLPIYTADTAQN
jgi:hypothetical protein